MDTITKPLNRRDLAKRATKEKALTSARKAFSTMDYNAASIRTLAKDMGMSVGAIFANFDSKADLWREAMGCEPPVDSPLTRAAPDLLEAAKDALVALRLSSREFGAEQRVLEAAIAKATA